METTTMDDHVHILIAPDGTCSVDDEYFTAPPGTSLNDAVLAHLRLEAAAMEVPVRAFIKDEQATYSMAIQVDPDGTSRPLVEHGEAAPVSEDQAPYLLAAPDKLLADPIRLNRPYDALPEPYRTRLQTICIIARQDDLDQATRDADQLLAELRPEYGPSHRYTLTVGTVRGDIAYLSRDYQYGLRIWTFMAKAWNQLHGSQHAMTIHATGNAVGCWRALPDPDAYPLGSNLATLLREVPIPGHEVALRLIDKRLHPAAT
jgi:hypothetical protein